MRAILCTRSGAPEVLKPAEVQKPTAGNGELLVKVHYATVTRGDVMLRKLPRFVLAIVGMLAGFKPMKIPGIEYAGEVVEIGAGVTSFKVGDEVVGTTTGLRYGANAEFVCVPQKPKQGVIVHKPAGVTYKDAAASVVGSMTAFQLLNKAKVRSGDSVLIYGASGSVGSFAVQLAHYRGAQVTAVCSTGNLELVTSIHADRVLDYTSDNFSLQGEQHDVVFDAVGKLPRADRTEALVANGRYVSVRSPTKEITEEAKLALELVASGDIRPVIDREYTLDEVVDAHRYVESGRKRGNVIIRI